MAEFQKVNRIYSHAKRFSWLLIPLVAVGGLWYPRLGLLMIPIMLTLLVMGFLKGKYWCGNFCPHGSLFDGIITPYSHFKEIPQFLKSKLVGGLALGWFMFMLGIRLIRVLAHWGTIDFWDKLGYVFVFNYLVVTVVGISVALLVNPRTWCAFCPMGVSQVIAFKLGRILNLNRSTHEFISFTDRSLCRECGLCGKVCPMQLQPYLDADDEGTLEDDHCIKCKVCVKNCPLNVLELGRES